MSTRLLMLTLTVGAFVAVWSGDRQDPRQNQSKLARIRSFKGSLPDPNFSKRDGVKVTLFWEDDEAESDPQSVSDSTETGFSIICLPEAAWMSSKEDEYDDEPKSGHHIRMFASSLKTEDWDLTSIAVWSNIPEVAVDRSDKTIPLPVDLTPGEYRIFNDAGDEYVESWTAAELASIGIPDSVPTLNSYMLEEQGRRWYFFRVNQPKSLSTSIEIETVETTGIPAFSENCDADLSVSLDPTETVAEGIRIANEKLDMAACRMKWFFSSMHRNVNSTIREAADSLAGMTAEALQRTRHLWERLEDVSTKTERVKTPIFNIRHASRFRCRRFY